VHGQNLAQPVFVGCVGAVGELTRLVFAAYIFKNLVLDARLGFGEVGVAATFVERASRLAKLSTPAARARGRAERKVKDMKNQLKRENESGAEVTLWAAQRPCGSARSGRRGSQRHLIGGQQS
jgi:hypothetical protein